MSNDCDLGQPHSAKCSHASLQGRCGDKGSKVIAMVADLCPECAGSSHGGQGDHFDLNALAYNKISPMISGRIDINWRMVACTPPSPLKVRVDGNSGPGLWLRLLITVSKASPSLAIVCACQGTEGVFATVNVG